MKKNIEPTIKTSENGERGAALVMVLLISSILLVAVIGLLMEASMNTANVTDATAEVQAYYAAESGIQSVVNVLRGNTVLPNSLRIDPTKPATAPANRINYFRATRLLTSNSTAPTAVQCAAASPPLDCTARLSRWMTYDATYTDRVILGNPSTYDPQTGFAYAVEIINPDAIGGAISYSTSIKFEGVATNSRTWMGATPADSATITYTPYSGPANIDVSSGQALTNVGSFRLMPVTGAGVNSFPRTRFAITVAYNRPYFSTKVIRGYIESGVITNANTTAWILYDSPVYNIFGSILTLSGGSDYEDTVPLPPPDSYYRVGYKVSPNAPSVTGVGETTPGVTTITGSVTAPEPYRLLIRSTGYGPLGARKQLESFIQKNYFNDLGAPSPLTLIGPPCTPVGSCIPPTPTFTWVAPNFVFNPGTATNTVYSGRDTLLRAFLPPIGVTNDLNYSQVRYALTHAPPNKYNGSIWGNAENIADELPFWLQSPRNLHETLMRLKAVAQASGRYYGPGVTPPGNGGYGSPSTPAGITYIDGPLTFSQQGGGILVVTGGLTFQGGFEFNGLIIVTGPAGINRTGGGSGRLQGNMIVAPYTDPTGTTLAGFLAPHYDISGGGSSEIVYNSNNVLAGLTELSNFVKGVAEK